MTLVFEKIKVDLRAMIIGHKLQRNNEYLPRVDLTIYSGVYPYMFLNLNPKYGSVLNRRW